LNGKGIGIVYLGIALIGSAIIDVGYLINCNVSATTSVCSVTLSICFAITTFSFAITIVGFATAFIDKSMVYTEYAMVSIR
jgi:uncharacterized membrane protein YkgB